MSKRETPSRDDARPEYFYRRGLDSRELLPAIGIGVAAGFAAFYLARLLLQRTPLTPLRSDAVSRRMQAARRGQGNADD